MYVQDIMSRAPVTVEERTPFRDVVAVLIDRDISSVPVLDRHGRLVGLVTEADLLAKEAFPEGRARRVLALLDLMLGGGDTRWIVRAGGLTAGDVMSTDVVTVGPRTEVRTAARQLLESAVSQLPVVDDGRLVGIVARRDVLRLFVRPDAAIVAELDATLAELRGQFPHDVTCSADDGIVTLIGSVDRAGQDEVIGRAAESIAGVVAVENLISVQRRAG